MKRSLNALWMALIVVMVFALAACGGPTMEEVVGKYELTEASITITMDGTTATAGMEYYDYARITLKDDGTMTVSVKVKGGTAETQNGTFTCGGGKITMTYKESGLTVKETYSYSNGVITLKQKLSPMQGMSIDATMKFTRVTE